MHVESKKVDQLTRRINLRLLDRFRLAEHRGGVQCVPPCRRQQIRRAKEDCRALIERKVAPCGGRAQGGIHGVGHVVRRRLSGVTQHRRVIMRSNNTNPTAGRHTLLTADRHRQIDGLPSELPKFGLKRHPLRCVPPVRVNWLVGRYRRSGNGIHGRPFAKRSRRHWVATHRPDQRGGPGGGSGCPCPRGTLTIVPLSVACAQRNLVRAQLSCQLRSSRSGSEAPDWRTTTARDPPRHLRGLAHQGRQDPQRAWQPPQLR